MGDPVCKFQLVGVEGHAVQCSVEAAVEIRLAIGLVFTDGEVLDLLDDLLDAIEVSVERDTRLGEDIERAQARGFAAFLDGEFPADRAHVAHVSFPLRDHAGDVECVADDGSALDLGDDGLLRLRKRNAEFFQPLVDPTYHVIFSRVRRSEYEISDRILIHRSKM